MSKTTEELYEECLKINIISLYDGYESTIIELAKRFEIPESQVRGYVEEEEKRIKNEN